MDWQRYARAALRKAYYALQKTTHVGIDTAFERTLAQRAEAFLNGERPPRPPVPRRALALRAFEDCDRYVIARDDIYTRFLAQDGGPDRDRFGRPGRWIPRGCVVYHDRKEGVYVKVFDRYFCDQGEGRFLAPALEAGFYQFLCPGLAYLLQDESGALRGYAIQEGEPVSSYAFERLVGRSLRDVLCAETERTGFYLNDLEFHNVVRHGNQLSVIDLESILPVSWFGTDLEFARAHLDEVDIGWPIQSKWCSPSWYGAFLRDLQERSGS